MQSDDKIKDLFSSGLGNFKPEVPEDIWSKIADKLPAEFAPVQQVQPRKVPLYKKLSVAVAGAAAVALCLLLIRPDGDTAKQISDNFQQTINLPSTSFDHFINGLVKSQDTEEKNNDAATPTTKTRSIIASNLPVKNTAHNNIADPFATNNATDNTPTVKITDKVEADDKNTADSKEPIDKTNLQDKIDEFANQGNTDIFAGNNQKKEYKKRGFTFSLGGNTGFSKDNNRTMAENALSKFDNMSEAASVPKENIPVKMDHKQPVSFGLTVSKDITEKLSLETGIIYTYLSSKAKSDRNLGAKRYDSQTFHYFGVPFSVNYNFAKLGKFDFYASAGGMIQKDVQGRLKGVQKEIIFQGETETEFKEEINQDKPQFSVSGKVGSTFPVYDKLYIYTTVGGAYYFDARNDYKTIYSDRKFQLDLNIGLKLKF